jgi:hypothetical protein
MSTENKSGSFLNAVKDALAKKQAAKHPDVKDKTDKSAPVKPTHGPAVITGKPVRKAAGRGG